MKAGILSLLSAVLISLALNPLQAEEKSEQTSPDRFTRMTQRMELNEQQSKELREVLEELKTARIQTLKELDENENKALGKVLKDDKKVGKVKRYLKYSARPKSNRSEQHKRKKRARPHVGVYPIPPKQLPNKK